MSSTVAIRTDVDRSGQSDSQMATNSSSFCQRAHPSDSLDELSTDATDLRHGRVGADDGSRSVLLSRLARSLGARAD